MSKLFVSALFLLIVLSQAGCIRTKTMPSKEIYINNTALKVEVASTLKQMAKGLGGRESLCAECGLFFDYDSDYQIRHFWMKDMSFPLDFIWLKDGLIVGLAENIPVLTAGQLTRLESPPEVNQVIEVNAGWISKNQLKIGDKINLD